MIDLKTSRVLELAAVLGALSGDARHIESLRTFAHHLGLAFQISDDLLDLTGDEASFGKSIGGDIVEGKRTLLFVLATEYSAGMAGADRELLNRIRDRSASASDVPSARDLFDRLGVLDEASRMAADQTRLAKNALEGIQPRADIALLRDFSDYLLRRSN
jgi:geranylgeranyl diphosphate synthase type II